IVLAAAGLFSLLAYAVSRRSREIGIRFAIGASRWRIAALVIRQGVTVTASGLLIGLVAARLLMRFMASVLLEVKPTDPAVFLLATVVLLLVAVGACLLPLWRALTIDPVTSLRTE